MKNLKNTVAAFGMMVVLGMGAVSANAGILMSDRSNGGQQICGTTKGGLLNQISGILLMGAPMLDGIIIIGREGLMMSDKQNCNTAAKDGIIIIG